MATQISLAFGKVLRQLRLGAELTQEQLGLDAELQRNYISSLELGEKQPTITSIFKLSQALKIRPSKLVALIESEMK